MKLPIVKTLSFYGVTLAVTALVWLTLFPLDNSWIFSLESYAFEIILLLLIGGFLFFILNKPRLMVVFFSGCALLSYALNERTVSGLKPAQKSLDAISIKVGAFQLSATAIVLDSLLHEIGRQNLDLVSLQDIRPEDLSQVHDSLTDHGYQHFQIQPEIKSRREMALYSKFPIDFLRTIRHQEVPSMYGKIHLPTKDSILELRFIQTRFPEQETEGSLFSGQLLTMARQLNHSSQPALALGNFNLVSWAYYLQRFKDASQLKDSRRGIRPASSDGNITIFDRPTDYIFYSNHFKCISFETISCGAATHAGIVGTYQLQVKGPSPHVQQTSQEF